MCQKQHTFQKILIGDCLQKNCKVRLKIWVEWQIICFITQRSISNRRPAQRTKQKWCGNNGDNDYLGCLAHESCLWKLHTIKEAIISSAHSQQSSLVTSVLTKCWIQSTMSYNKPQLFISYWLLFQCNHMLYIYCIVIPWHNTMSLTLKRDTTSNCSVSFTWHYLKESIT